MPYISTEALVGAALLVVLAFGYQHVVAGNADSAVPAKKKKKNNKKKAKASVADDVTPVAVTSGSEPETAKSTKSKKKNKGKQQAAVKEQQPTPQSALPQPEPASPSPEDVSPPEEAKSFADAASDGPKEPAKPKMLAEKLLPKPRKTKVDDMLEPEDRAPHIARVMKITHETPASQKVASFANDYEEDSEGSSTHTPNDGWNVVPTKKKPVSLSIGGSPAPYKHSSDTSDGLTKVQRKNQKKAEAKRAAKAEEEADRLRRLAMHKKTLEREKINQIYSESKKKVVRSNGKVLSGGQSATVSSSGQLVWE